MPTFLEQAQEAAGVKLPATSTRTKAPQERGLSFLEQAQEAARSPVLPEAPPVSPAPTSVAEAQPEEPGLLESTVAAISAFLPVPQRMMLAQKFPGMVAPPSDAEVEEWNKTSKVTKLGREAGMALLTPLKNIPKMLPKKSPMPKGVPAPTVESEMIARAARQPPVTPPPPKLLSGAVASTESEAIAIAARQPHLAPQQPPTPKLLTGSTSPAQAEALARAARQPHLAPQQPATLKLLSEQRGAVRLPPSGPPPPPAGTPLRAIDDLMGTPSKTKTTSGLTRVREQLEDRFAPLEVWEKSARGAKTLKGVPVRSSPYKLARIYAGRFGKIQNAFDEVRGILQPFHGFKNKEMAQDFERYWLTKRVEERLERGIPSGRLTTEDTQGAIRQLSDKYGADGVRAFQGKVDELVAFTDRKILQPMLDTGLLNRAQYDAIKLQNKNWAPFDVLHHLPDDPDALRAGSEVFSVARQDVVRGMKGFEEGEIRSLFDALASRIPHAISLVERNKVARAFFKVVEDNPALQGQVVPAGTGKIPRGMGELSAFIDGSKQTFWAPKEIADAMKHMDPVTTGFFGEGVARLTGAFRKGATSTYLPFVISNSVRDFKMAKLMNRHGFSVKDWMYGLKEGMKASYGFDSPLYRDILEAGGGFSTWTQQMKKASSGKGQFMRSKANMRLRKVVNPFELVSNFSQSVELAPRIGLARRARRAGEGIAEQAWAARIGTIDFSKAGAAMRTWNLFVPFLNARLQGRMNVVTAFREGPVHAASVMLKWGFLPGLASYAYNTIYQNELMDDVPQWIKDNYDYLIVGEVFDERLQRMVPDLVIVPKGDLGQIAWNPMQNALDYIKANDKPSVVALATKFLSEVVSPIEFAKEGGEVSALRAMSQVVPPPMLGPIEVATGKKFYFDANITPRRLEGLKKEEQYLESTPEAVKTLASKVGLSPLETQHLLQSLFAGTAREVLEPTSIPGLVMKRFRRPGGGVKEKKAYKLIGEGTEGYKTARHRALRMIKEKKSRKEIFGALAAWNKEAKELAKKMGALGLPVKRFRKEITFGVDDYKRIIQSARKEQRGQSPLARRLGSR